MLEYVRYNFAVNFPDVENSLAYFLADFYKISLPRLYIADADSPRTVSLVLEDMRDLSTPGPCAGNRYERYMRCAIMHMRFLRDVKMINDYNARVKTDIGIDALPAAHDAMGNTMKLTWPVSYCIVIKNSLRILYQSVHTRTGRTGMKNSVVLNGCGDSCRILSSRIGRAPYGPVVAFSSAGRGKIISGSALMHSVRDACASARTLLKVFINDHFIETVPELPREIFYIYKFRLGNDSRTASVIPISYPVTKRTKDRRFRSSFVFRRLICREVRGREVRDQRCAECIPAWKPFSTQLLMVILLIPLTLPLKELLAITCLARYNLCLTYI